MISVVIPNYNSGKLLVKNLSNLIKLLNSSKLDFELIIADDASTDDSIEILNSFQRGGLVKVIGSNRNTGFGANVDRGIRASVGEIVFVLNAIDLMPEKFDYFKLMLKHFEDPKVFSVGALKREKEDHGCGEIYFEKGYFLHGKRPFDPAQGTPISSGWADGGAEAIRKSYYLKIGGFDPKYFLYWEDVDLGFRAQKAGYKIVFEPKAVLIHQKNEGPISKRFSQEEIRRLNIKNQIYFTWKNSDLKHRLLFLLWLPYHLAISLKNRDWLFLISLLTDSIQ